MKEEYSNNTRRWYDKDPVLSCSMKTLEESDDETQIRIALNLIKIIIEHNIASDQFTGVDDILSAVEDCGNPKGSDRWYDLDATVRTAITMLENCPFETQKEIAKEMAQLVVDKLKEDSDSPSDDELEEDE